MPAPVTKLPIASRDLSGQHIPQVRVLCSEPFDASPIKGSLGQFLYTN
jgi:hypothetical protein